MKRQLRRPLPLPVFAFACLTSCAMFAFSLFASVASAQDTGDPDAGSSLPRHSSAERAVIDSVTESGKRSARAAMAGVENLLRIEQYESIRPYLTSLSATSDVVLHQLYEEFGPAIFVQLTQTTELAPEGPEFGKRVLQVANRSLANSSRIHQLLDRMVNQDTVVRQRATADVYRLGVAAVPQLIQRLADASLSDPRPYRAALIRVGAPAADAVSAALDSSSPVLRREMVAVLGMVGDKSAAHYLLQPYFDADPAIARAAAVGLQNIWQAQPSDVSQAVQLLRAQVQRRLQSDPPARPDEDGMLAIWSWNGRERSVTEQKASAADAAALAAARLARDLYRLQPNSHHLRLLLTARLQVDQSMGGRDSLLRRGPGTAFDLGVQAGATGVEQVLADALDQQRHATVVAAAEVLSEIGGPELLASHDGTPRPLAAALRSSNRRARFAAARAIMKLNPTTRYPGASHLPETLGDLMRVSSRPQALIGHPNALLAGQLAGRLAEIGYAVDVRHTGRAFLKAAFTRSDYEFLLVSDALDCPPENEVLQQLRKDPYTLDVPVAVLYRSDPGLHGERAERLADLDDQAIAFPEEVDHDTLAVYLGRLLAMARPESCSRQTCVAQAQEALRWMIQLARDPDQYGWYDLHRQEDAVVTASSADALHDDALTLLGYFGTARAQTILVDSITAPSDDASRANGKRAFQQAVSQRGVMLRGSQVQQQAERSHADSGSDDVSQTIQSRLQLPEGLQSTRTGATRRTTIDAAADRPRLKQQESS